MHAPPLTVLGWREWLALPEFGIAAIKAKIDTGARSSALHVEQLEQFEREGRPWLRFVVATGNTGADGAVHCEAPGLDRRPVTDSGGHTCERWFIRTTIVLAGQRWAVEINLTNRRNMLFPMLLGRTAMQGRFLVDPLRSYQCGEAAHAVISSSR